MTPAQLSDAIVAALTAQVEAGDAAPARRRAHRGGRGAPAEQGARRLRDQRRPPAGQEGGAAPRDLAQSLAEALSATDGIAKVDIAGPGFLNITVSAGAQGKVAADVVAAGAAYGRSETLAGTRINVEFISANPTGPLHLGHTRWAAVGDAIARVLDAAGAEVTREFYINDRGTQMDKFGASVEAAALGQPVPDDGYHGAYIADLARRVVAEQPGILDLPEEERLVAVPRGRLRPPAGRAAGAAGELPHPLRRVVLRALAARTSQRSPRTSRSCGARGTSSTRTAPCGCVRRTRATTRTGC